jgi:hypothetical protein
MDRSPEMSLKQTTVVLTKNAVGALSLNEIESKQRSFLNGKVLGVIRQEKGGRFLV